MTISLIAIGKLRGPELELFAEYAKRLRPGLAISELTVPEQGNAATQKTREGDKLLAALPKNAYVVALDPKGIELDSPALSKKLGAWLARGQAVTFVIGGAEGLSEAVKERADVLLSFGKPTWPHLLCRVMLAEQLYRAQQIAAGHPYHRE